MRNLIRVTVAVDVYFDDDINDPDRRSDRLHQISEAVGTALRRVDGTVRHRMDASADYVREIQR